MWTLEKLNQYISDKVEESLYLDYKAADALSSTDGKKNEISKDVSAFANSDGGTIIYGVKEFQSGTTYLPEKVDPVLRTAFSKETLEQVINARISPRIHGIIITPITIGEEVDNQVVYVVEIPKSNTAHQANDKRYYRRFNFLSVAMDDWEIKDIINRQDKAVIEITFRPRFNPAFFSTFIKAPGRTLSFDIVATNVGHKVVNYCDCMIIGNVTVAKMLKPEPHISRGENYFEKYYTNEIERKATLEDNEFVVNVQRMPILPQTYRVLGEIEFYSDFFINEHSLRVTVALDDNRITKKLSSKEVMK